MVEFTKENKAKRIRKIISDKKLEEYKNLRRTIRFDYKHFMGCFLDSIKEHRNKQHLTQYEAGIMSGIVETTVQNIENAVADPKLSTLYKYFRSIKYPFIKNLLKCDKDFRMEYYKGYWNETMRRILNDKFKNKPEMRKQIIQIMELTESKYDDFLEEYEDLDVDTLHKLIFSKFGKAHISAYDVFRPDMKRYLIDDQLYDASDFEDEYEN